MVRSRPGSRHLLRFAVALVALPSAFAAGPAPARQVLLVAEGSGNNRVGEYSAVTGAAISAAFVPSLPSGNHPVVLDANNHLFVGGSTVGEYNATTGATINSAFIAAASDGLARDGSNHIFVANAATDRQESKGIPTGPRVVTCSG
jgi:hypothetical protein